MDPITQHYRLNKPCTDCPFLKKGAVELREGRLEGIIEDLLSDDSKSFLCHKTVHCNTGGEWLEDNYMPSGNESMCYGAAAYLTKVHRPTIGMRMALVTKSVDIDYWEKSGHLIIDPK